MQLGVVCDGSAGSSVRKGRLNEVELAIGAEDGTAVDEAMSLGDAMRILETGLFGVHVEVIGVDLECLCQGEAQAAQGCHEENAQPGRYIPTLHS